MEQDKKTEDLLKSVNGITLQMITNAVSMLIQDGSWQVTSYTDDTHLELDTNSFPPSEYGPRTRTITIHLIQV